MGVNTNLFNFADANHDEGFTLISHWTPVWTTGAFASGYHWAGANSEKVGISLTRKSQHWGALTVGGLAGHDNGIIPKYEALIEYDRGFAFRQNTVLPGIEVICGEHWYWYSTARIVTINETTLFYLPRDWTWSFGVSGAQSDFYGAGSQWRPSGMTRVGFPVRAWEIGRVAGNIFFAVGAENFAQVDQIAEFSSQTYGAGLRLQLTQREDVTGFGAYQRRSSNRRETSFGLSYAIRF
jgi:hypothetical protein